MEKENFGQTKKSEPSMLTLATPDYSNDNYHIYTLLMGPNDESEVHQHLFNCLFVCMSHVVYTEEVYDEFDELIETNEIDEAYKTILPKEYSVNNIIHKEITDSNGGFHFLVIESLELYGNTEDPMSGSEQVFENFNTTILYGGNDMTMAKNSVVVFFSLQKNSITLNGNPVYGKVKGDFINLDIGDSIQINGKYALLVEFN